MLKEEVASGSGPLSSMKWRRGPGRGGAFYGVPLFPEPRNIQHPTFKEEIASPSPIGWERAGVRVTFC
jgi:hypothetical protein